MKRPSTTRIVPLLTALILTLASLLAPLAARAEYRGNRSSHVFHAPSCRYFDCANCTVVFASVRAAIDAGYRPCGTCRPASPSEGVGSAPDVRGHFVGNRQSHVFHRSTCRYSDCRHCTVGFSTRRAALEAGYRPGGCCRP